MRDASPADAERLHSRLKEACTDKRVPIDFKVKASQLARTRECDANMRATDEWLRNAMRMATGEHMKERSKTLSEARVFFGKACTLGANDEFRRATQRLIDTIMLSGGVVHAGPTRAKPLDTAPKAPNRAKESTTPDPGPPQPSQEQLKALFQDLLHKIPISSDRRQLEEATQGALRLMLRRAGDKDLLASLQRQANEITRSLPEVIQGEQAKADMKKAALGCIEILKQAKKLRKPRPPGYVAAIGAQKAKPHKARYLILGCSLTAILAIAWVCLHHH
jgi:hypothetical protein